jgi:ABC-type lipoprotein export system ATPase subunit
MQITLQHIVPIPLKEKVVQKTSDVWNTELQFTSKEWVKIKAPSGTGKTTLTHIVYKLRSDFAGDVLWNETSTKNIVGDVLAKIRQQQLSIIFQDLRLLPNLTARENIELNRVLQEPYYDTNKIEEMAQQLGVEHVLQQRAGLCSYGEQQRIAIVRALMQPFEILLMDEPFSHLDKKNTSIAAELIAIECTKRNAGFVLTDLDDDDHFNYHRKLNL